LIFFVPDFDMLRICTDFNTREGPRTIVLAPQVIPQGGLVEGTRVILYEEGDIECEAIVRRGDTWNWVADIIEGTIRKLPP
jgi:hypothetical protein